MPFPVFPDLGWWAYILVAVFLSHPITMSVTLHLHRSSTHGSVKFHPVINGSLRFISWFFTGMKEREWVSVNRKHHMHADRAGDPHSPLNEGLFRMLWKGVVLYRREAKDPTTIRRYGYGTSDDWVERHIFGHRYFCWSGVVVHFFLEAFLFGWKGILIWGFLTAARSFITITMQIKVLRSSQSGGGNSIPAGCISGSSRFSVSRTISARAFRCSVRSPCASRASTF